MLSSAQSYPRKQDAVIGPIMPQPTRTLSRGTGTTRRTQLVAEARSCRPPRGCGIGSRHPPPLCRVLGLDDEDVAYDIDGLYYGRQPRRNLGDARRLPRRFDVATAVPGNDEPFRAIIDQLRHGGMRSVSPLGNSTTASAAREHILNDWSDNLVSALGELRRRRQSAS